MIRLGQPDRKNCWRGQDREIAGIATAVAMKKVETLAPCWWTTSLIRLHATGHKPESLGLVRALESLGTTACRAILESPLGQWTQIAGGFLRRSSVGRERSLRQRPLCRGNTNNRSRRESLLRGSQPVGRCCESRVRAARNVRR